nr:hypothetical protein BaRGS_019174 [Batillaria attramentaria]
MLMMMMMMILLAAVVAQNKFAAEQLDAVIARMSLIKKFVDKLELFTFPGLTRSDVNQDNDIANLEEHLNDLMTKLNGLDGDIDWLETQNGRNSNYTQDLENAWAGEKREDVDQDGDVASLYAAVTDFKSKLFTVLGNEFELFADQVETTAGEVGTTSLLGDDRVVEYVFQSDFDEVPSVQYSITDINWNLDAREDPQHYGYGPPPQEPNAAGFVILAYPTKRSVVFRGYDFSFGDSQGINGNINFIACTIGPGTEESDAHDVTPVPATTYGN